MRPTLCIIIVVLCSHAHAQVAVWEDKADGQGPFTCCRPNPPPAPPTCTRFFWPDNDDWEQAEVPNVDCVAVVPREPSNWTTPSYPDGITYQVSIDANPAVSLSSFVTVGSLSVGSSGEIDLHAGAILVPLGAIINNGMISGSGSLRGANLSTLTNTGSITAPAATTLTLQSIGNIYNDGQILAAGGTLRLVANADVFNATPMRAASGGVLALGAGTYWNTSVIAAEDASAVALEDYALIVGGEFRSTLNNSWIETAFAIHRSAAISGPITNNSQFRVKAGNLHIQGSTALSGSGQLLVQGAGVFGDPTTDPASQIDRLTNIAGHAIRGYGRLGADNNGDPGGPELAITNDSLIEADGGVLQLDPPDGLDTSVAGVTNHGVLRSTHGATLTLTNGLFLNNGVIEADDNSIVSLESGALIVGGEFRSTLANSWVQTRPAETHPATITGAITNNSQLRVIGPGSLEIQGATILTGVGQLLIQNANVSGASATDPVDEIDRLTNSAGHKIRGSGRIGADNAYPDGPELAITNDSVIEANGGSLQIDPPDGLDPSVAGVTNNGVLRSTNGALLLLADGLFLNNGRIEANDTSVVSLKSGVLLVGGELLTTSSDGWIEAASIFSKPAITGTIVNNSQFRVIESAALRIRGDTILGGLGQLLIEEASVSGDPTTPPDAVVDRLTNGVGHLIHGYGRIGGDNNGDASGPDLAITNDSLIEADGGTLQIDPRDGLDPSSAGVTNNGVLRCTSGATLRLSDGLYRNIGSIEADDASIVSLDSGALIVGGELRSSASNSWIQAASTNQPTITESILNNAQFRVIESATLRIRGDTTLSGRGRLLIQGRNVYGDSATAPATLIDQLTNSAGHVIAGYGRIGADNNGSVSGPELAITNDSLIEADGGALLIDPPDGFDVSIAGLTNNGVLRSTNGSTLRLSDGVYLNNGIIEADDNSIVSLETDALVAGGELRSSSNNSWVQAAAAAQPAIAQSILNNAQLRVIESATLRVHGNTSLFGTGRLTVLSSVQGDPNTDEATTVDSLTNLPYHVIGGSGTIGPGLEFVNDSVVQPGAPVGTLIIDTRFRQLDDGLLVFDIFGPTLFDRLQVTQTATLDGELRLALPKGYGGMVGASYVILTAPTVVGAFATTHGPGDFVVEYQTNAVVVRFTRMPCDHDGDNDCDLVDFKAFIACLSLPDLTLIDPQCEDFDFDGDGDVDVRDYQAIVVLFTG